jgi:lactate dehydrogenase-like 2-hydroxyacid dehydrogenase
MAQRLKTFNSHIRTSAAAAVTRNQQRTMSSQAKLSLAVLDDYADTAPRHFSHIEGLTIDQYPETLNAAKDEGVKALAKRLQSYQIISTMRERTAFPAELLKQLPNLKLLLTTGNRNASIDSKAASDQGIIVAGTTGGKPKKPENYSTDDLPPPPGAGSVNQHSWALLLGLCSRLPEDDNTVKTDPKGWQSGLMIPLGGKTIGLVGLGNLGTAMAKTAILGFGMKVIAWSENLTQEKADASAEKAGLAKGALKVVGKEELFQQADVVSLHLVLSDRSRGIVGAKELGLMKKSAILLNVSRGGLIDEAALLKVVKEGSIRGLALDVFWEEPLPPDSPWRSKDFKTNVVYSPHMGYVNAATMNRWYEAQAENVERWIRGEDLVDRLN